MYNPDTYVFCFRMVVITRHRAGGSGLGSGSGSGLGFEPVNEGLREFIVSEIMRDILESTPMIFGSIKEGIIKLIVTSPNSRPEKTDLFMLCFIKSG